MHPEQQDSPKSLDPSAVRQYLTMNPDFFNQHADVLPRLHIPHDVGGGTVSLIERQVSVLRGKCNRLESSLRDLISVARENERLHMRLHRLIQDIISAESMDELVIASRDSLIENFKADDVRLFLTSSDEELDNDKAFERVKKSNHYTLSSKDPVFEMFAKTFSDAETYCGPLNEEQRALLCTGCESELASAAIIPLQYNGQQGLLVMGSSDETRFSAGKGVMFLNQLGEVLSRRVQSFELQSSKVTLGKNPRKSKKKVGDLANV